MKYDKLINTHQYYLAVLANHLKLNKTIILKQTNWIWLILSTYSESMKLKN